MTDEPIKAINILYDGAVAEMNLDALNCAVIAGIMKRDEPGREHGVGARSSPRSAASRSRPPSRTSPASSTAISS